MSVPSCSWLPSAQRRRRLALPLLALAALSACGPVYRAKADLGLRAGAANRSAFLPSASVKADARRPLGSWAHSDNGDLLFHLPLRPDGSILATAGSLGPRTEASGRLTDRVLLGFGR